MSGHPPFGAQIILNGHEYVAAAARAAGIGFTKEGNCFTRSTGSVATRSTTESNNRRRQGSGHALVGGAAHDVRVRAR